PPAGCSSRAAPRGPAPCARRARSARRTPRYRVAGSRAATLAGWLARRPWTAPPLDRVGAETLQPAPYLDPEVVGLVYHARNYAARLRWIGITSREETMGPRFSALAALLLIMPARQQAQQPFAPIDWKQVDAGLGKSGTLQPDGAYKVGMPRGDLHVTAAGVAIKPALALGSWVAFKQVSDTEAMLMGDLVLLESEVSPVLGKLQDGGIEQTALHNHLQHESPRVMYMHIGGHGAPARLAAAVHSALALTSTPFGAPSAAASVGSFGIDTAQLRQ